ncbi:LPS export ABC transporter periplasmic protein LptC [Gallaecimonas mangrovi]|uniref:LPS export ABC transporter periplasmic protein LptC n=1 Tax=Gallaecimonas mangrovi TaxID=2291597 RepID=UPI000E1FD466|nr:LPS export ABC transporter periplasmic protein LptC [Gallaecimonas mangrovi]
MSRAVIFVLLLFAAASALMLWPSAKDDQDAAQQALLVEQPDGIADNLQVRQFDENGKLSMQVNAKSMTHYNLRQETWLVAPRFITYNNEQHSPWRITAEKAKVTGQRLVDLQNNVIIQSLIDDGPIKQINTDALELNLVKKTMNTDDPVVIVGPGYTTKGVGLNAKLDEQQVRLKSQVSTEYEQLKDTQ